MIKKSTIGNNKSKSATVMEEIIDLLIRLREYMDDKSDADFDYETHRFIANTEMKFYNEIDDVLKKIKTIETHNTNIG